MGAPAPTVGPRVRIIGRGRAGGSFALALSRVGWSVVDMIGRDGDVAGAAAGVDLVLVCVPDAVVAEVAAAVVPGDAVVAHVAGSLTLEVLGAHPHAASVHPLVALPTAEVGASRLQGAWFAVAGSDGPGLRLVERVVTDLEGHVVHAVEAHRAEYHAAAVIASNHVVALLGQAARVADVAGVPLEAYLDLVRGTVENVAELGPAAALTGPVARGDWGTVRRHLESLPEGEREGYRAMVHLAARLVDRIPPEDLDPR